MEILLSIIVAILVLSWLVIIHEIGHFVVAKWAKVKVEEFGLGYPPLAKKLFRKWDVDFTLNWIPFGGFVKMVGEENPDGAAASKADQSGLYPLYARPAWQRVAVLVAGAAVNILFAVIAFSVVFSIKGIPQEITQARIGQVQEGSPAAQAGVPAQVEIIAVEAGGELQPVRTIDEAQAAIKAHQGQEIVLITTGPCTPACQESSARYQVYVRTEAERGPEQGAIGIVFEQLVFVHYPWYEMPVRGTLFGLKQTAIMIVLTLQALQNAAGVAVQQGQVPGDLSGPVGIVDQVANSQIIEQGFLAVLGMAGSLSLGLGIMNLLPIPPLDGGRVVFVILEQVIGKKRVAKVEGYSHSVGMVLLLIMIVVISANDIWKIIAR